MRKEITFRMRRAVFNPYKKNIAGEPVRMAELLLSKNGFSIAPDSQGNLGVFRPDGTELAYWTQDRFIFIGQGSNKGLEFSLNGQQSPLNAGDPFVFVDTAGNLVINCGSSGNLYLNYNVGYPLTIPSFSHLIYAPSTYLNLAGLGASFILSVDNRKGLSSVDPSPITLYPQAGQPPIGSGQLYRLSGRILATAGTGPSATYTLKWTEGGAVITKALTISALDSDSDFSALIQPDPNTSITVQLTAISGTGTTVNVAALVERLA